MIVSASLRELRALFSRLAEPPSWRVIQGAHAGLIVICSGLAYMAEDKPTIVLDAFLIGSSFASVGYIGALRYHQALVERLRDQLISLQQVLGPLEGRVFMMEIVPADDDGEERPTIN